MESTQADDRQIDLAAQAQVDAAALAISTLTQVIEHESTYEAVVQQVIDLAGAVIASADYAAVTVLDGGPARTVAYTDGIALEIDQIQYATGQGPCLEAATTGSLVRVGGPAVAQRWPDFARRVANTSALSYLSAPIVLNETVAGALNLYSKEDHGFGELDEAVLRIFVVAIATALRSARISATVHRELDGLHVAMESRAGIEQAKGVLMAVHRWTAEQAFAHLVEKSQNTNTKLTVLAQSVVDAASEA